MRLCDCSDIVEVCFLFNQVMSLHFQPACNKQQYGGTHNVSGKDSFQKLWRLLILCHSINNQTCPSMPAYVEGSQSLVRARPQSTEVDMLAYKLIVQYFQLCVIWTITPCVEMLWRPFHHASARMQVHCQAGGLPPPAYRPSSLRITT